MSFEYNATAKFEVICSKCNKPVEFDYAEDDLEKNEKLLFTCQNCNHSEYIKSQTIIDKAIEETKKALQKDLKKLFK